MTRRYPRLTRPSNAVVGRLDVILRRVLAAAVHVRARGQIVPNAHALVVFVRAFATAQIKPRDKYVQMDIFDREGEREEGANAPSVDRIALL